MARIGNAGTISDIEYVVEPPGAGSDVTAWTSHGVRVRSTATGSTARPTPFPSRSWT
jgi:hypothetical protein